MNIKALNRSKRHTRIRKKVKGSQERPRLSVFRSAKHMNIQVVDDVKGLTLASFSTASDVFKKKSTYGGNVNAAKVLGEMGAEELKKKKINKVVFDRGGYLYHGRVRVLADTLRENGIQF